MTHQPNFKCKVFKLAHDVRIDFEAKELPVKGLQYQTFDADGKVELHSLGPTAYIPEPRVLPKGIEYHVDGWWKDHGHTWRESAEDGNPAALQYAFRREAAGLPDDDAVLYGHTRGFDPYAYLLHVSELDIPDTFPHRNECNPAS